MKPIVAGTQMQAGYTRLMVTLPVCSAAGWTLLFYYKATSLGLTMAV